LARHQRSGRAALAPVSFPSSTQLKTRLCPRWADLMNSGRRKSLCTCSAGESSIVRAPLMVHSDLRMNGEKSYKLLKTNERMPGRGFEPRQENPPAIRVLARWDFLSYPESYPRQSRAAMGPPDIGWARMSRWSPAGRHSRFCQFSRDGAKPFALTRLQGYDGIHRHE
jgi:hypothetical protein